MNWFVCILYGLIQGITEFIPVPSGAQGYILQFLFGAPHTDAVRELIVHIFSLIAFLVAWRNPLGIIRNNTRLAYARSGRHGKRVQENADSRFVRAAAIPMLLTMILAYYFVRNVSMIPMALLLVVNGIVLYLPERMLQGNKTSWSMSAFDAWLVGISGALSVIPGFSRIGMIISASQIRGADRKNALNWSYMLSVPALLLLIGADLVSIVFAGQTLTLSTGFGGYLLMAASSFAGSYLSVYFLRNMILHRSMSTFAYYSWGAALFTFILYLL